jgi:hypothetical protein
MKGNFARNCVKKESYFQCNSVMSSLKCPKSKSLSHCLTELSIPNSQKHQTAGWLFHQPIIPPYHIEDCWILNEVFNKTEQIHSRLFIYILAGLLPYGSHIRVKCKLDLSEMQRSLTWGLLFVINHRPQPNRKWTHNDMLLLGVLL